MKCDFPRSSKRFGGKRKTNKMYTALVLDKQSKKKLLEKLTGRVPSDWEVIAHHMTINMGPITKGPANPDLLGTLGKLSVVSLASDEKVMAVGVRSDVPSKNDKPHVTIAVNRAAGGKPFLSNKLTEWEPLMEPFELTGVIQQVG